MSVSFANNNNEKIEQKRERERALTEHLEGLPHGLFVKNVMGRVGVIAVLYALHVLRESKRRTEAKVDECDMPAIYSTASYSNPEE